MALSCSNKMSDIYHSCDIDTLTCFLSKSGKGIESIMTSFPSHSLFVY